jgi:hypothetical protein
MIILTRRAFLAGTTALAASGLAPFHALAAQPRTYRALLIACTDYPNLPKKYSLVGPNNDAELIREYLTKSAPVKFAPENITVLADNVDGVAGSPTHEAIVAAFADLAERTQQGDFVYLHLSGHGTQQPQPQAGDDETDGYDEVFLPRSTGRWADRTKGIPDALVDNEIGNAIDAIRRKGAFVWVIFDCCQSGTATRAAEVNDEMERKVDFFDLVEEGARAAAEKADAEAQAAAATAATRAVADDPNARKAAFNLPTSAESVEGGLVAFFAAQTTETTPEKRLPKGDPQARVFGLFTYTIFSKLAENPNVSYRQLGQAVLQQYSALGLTRPTPLFEGLLDARVFDSTGTGRALQWPLKIEGSTVTVEAGRLQRLEPGTKLAVLRDPRDELSAALGYLSVKSAETLSCELEPVAYGGKPAIKLADIPAGAWAQVAELAIDFKLAVARPGPSDGLDTETALVNSVLDELLADEQRGFNAVLVEPGQGADVRLAVLRENAIEGAPPDAGDEPALWLLPASGDVMLKDGSRPPLIVMDPDDRAALAEKVKKNLTTIFRAISLSRLASLPGDAPEGVSVEFRIKRKATGTMEPLTAAEVPRAGPDDQVHVVAKNGSGKYYDLNILYIGSDYSISHLPPARRLEPGSTLEKGLFRFTDKSFGMERMIAVFTEVSAQRELEDLGFLAQDGVPQKTRDVGGKPRFADMLLDIGLAAPATRSVATLDDEGGGSAGAVMIYQIETVKPAG